MQKFNKLILKLGKEWRNDQKDAGLLNCKCSQLLHWIRSFFWLALFNHLHIVSFPLRDISPHVLNLVNFSFSFQGNTSKGHRLQINYISFSFRASASSAALYQVRFLFQFFLRGSPSFRRWLSSSSSSGGFRNVGAMNRPTIVTTEKVWALITSA